MTDDKDIFNHLNLLAAKLLVLTKELLLARAVIRAVKNCELDMLSEPEWRPLRKALEAYDEGIKSRG